MEQQYQISFLPWVAFDKAIEIGPIILWPFFLEVEHRIKDRKIIEYLKKYFKSYVDYKEVPVEKITICTHGKDYFRYLNEFELKELRNAIDILTFLSIAPRVTQAVCMDNSSFGPPSADIFELITQNFLLTNNYISIEVGSITHTGYKIGEINFPKPFATGGIIGNPGEQFINAINKCLSSNHLTELKERLLRTLEWFRMAHIEGGQVSIHSKIVMLSTAFEIFQTSPKGTRWYFIKYIEHQIASKNIFRGIRTNGKGEKRDLSLAGCWAFDFYGLRNKIVHGEEINNNDLRYRDWITHLIVADLMLYQCIKKALYINDCFDKSFDEFIDGIKKIFNDKILDDDILLLLNISLGFKHTHEALGWIKNSNEEYS
jgi:hypothetical protein